ncbi:MAG: FAD binding domain-containing protein [Alicyclobacillus sp.]|nr:FAD binding domain-containing protein [Alicyclobacillus sp.]
MIPFDFEYLPAHTTAEAVAYYVSRAKAGQSPLYCGGATEVVTLGRIGQLETGAVIDIRHIPSAQVLTQRHDQVVAGAGVTLTQIADSVLIAETFPLLAASAREIADRTARNQITLGGNICGQIFYREAVLPLLVCESAVRLAGPNGLRELPMDRVFDQTLRLQPGEFLVQTATDTVLAGAPWVYVKRRKMGSVGYPVVSAAAIRVDRDIRVAVSGVYPFPVRALDLEQALNRRELPLSRRIEAAVSTIRADLVLDDVEAARGYRLFVLRDVLREIVESLDA